MEEPKPQPNKPARFETVVSVDMSDIDVLGHVSNVAYVRFIQDIAVQHSASLGLDIEAYRQLQGVFVVARHEIDYLRAALAGDRLRVSTWVESMMAAKCLRATEIVRESDLTPIVRSMTTWGFVDMRTARPIRIPLPVHDAFRPALS
jgi:acyl-CoA thioester hydrolase